MPAPIAQVVMRMGRRREVAEERAEAAGSAVRRRSRSAKVTRRMALAMATPTAMIAPIADWRLRVVPVNFSARTTPASTPGTAAITTKARRRDWKFAVRSKKMTAMAMRRPELKPSVSSVSGPTWPR